MRRYNVREGCTCITCIVLDQRTVESNTITCETINGKSIQTPSISEFNGHKGEIEFKVKGGDMDKECIDQESMFFVLVSPP